MKIKHNVPTELKSATVSAEYQAEIDRTMYRARLRWDSEQAALAKAERRRQRLAKSKPKTARRSKITKRKIAEIDALIEMHRLRLQDMQALMTAHSASTTHRGRGSYRPVPKQGDVI